MDFASLQDEVKRDLTADVIRQFGEARFKVTGTSMLPSVWPGDVITVRRQSAAELSLGQIVLCYRNQAFVAHRVVGERDEGLITRGDSLPYDDPPFSESEVLGAVVSIVRNGRPVEPPSAWWLCVGSAIVRHSDLCTRIMLRLQRSSRMSWAS
jgi:signal peptidase I